MSDVTIDQHGELYQALRSTYDTDPDAARILLADLDREALSGVMACAQAEQHDLYGIAADHLPYAGQDDDGVLTEQETLAMLETYAAEIRELYTDREAIIGARELFSDAWHLVERLGSTDPTGTGEKIRYHADPQGLVFVLAHMVNVAADAASFVKLAETVQAGLFGEFAPDQLAEFARTLPKMEQHPRADWCGGSLRGRFVAPMAAVSMTFGRAEAPIDRDKSHFEWYLDTPHGKATIYDYGDCHDCGFGCKRDPRFGVPTWCIGAEDDAAAEWVLAQLQPQNVAV